MHKPVELSQASPERTTPTKSEKPDNGFHPLGPESLMSAQSSILPVEERPLSVAEHRDWAGLQSIRACWSNLLAQLPGLSIFLTPEWLFSWWRAYGEGKDFCVLVFSGPQSEVVGIAPLYFERKKSPLLPELRVLRMIGDGSNDSDDLDFIVKPGYAEAVTHALLDWMRAAPWDTCEFNCLASQSEVAALLASQSRALGWRVESALRPLARINFPATWEQYLKQLSSKERGKIGHRLRRLQARHAVRFRRCEHPDELPVFLDALFSLHQKRWEARGEPGTFAQPERRRFYVDMTRELFRRDWLELWLLEVDGVSVASQIGMRYGSCFYALQEGFDSAYAADSVGYVLRSQILRNCVDSGARTYDFLYGDQESKLRWNAQVGHYLDLHLARSGLGAFYLAGRQALRSRRKWLRAHLPAGTIKMLQSLRRSLHGGTGKSKDTAPADTA